MLHVTTWRLVVVIALAATVTGCRGNDRDDLANGPHGNRQLAGGHETFQPGDAEDHSDAHAGANPTVVEKVQRTLDTDATVGGYRLRAEAAGPGVMRITGRVDAEPAKQHAEELAAHVGGVERVQNEVRVGEGAPGDRG